MPKLRVYKYPWKLNAPIIAGNECDGIELNQTAIFLVSVKFLKPMPQSRLNFHVSSLGIFELDYTGITNCTCSNNVSNRQNCNYHGFLICGTCVCEEPWYCIHLLVKGEEINANVIKIVRFAQILAQTKYVLKMEYAITVEDAPAELLQTVYPTKVISVNVEEHNVKIFKINYVEDHQEAIAVAIRAFVTMIILEKIISCSGLGDCVCGECKCNVDRGGKFCEIRNVPYTCSDFQNDVLCFLHNESITDGLNCSEKKILVTTVAGSNFHCALIDQFDCEIYFNFTLNENEEFVLHVRNYNPETDCPKPINVLLVTGCIFAALFVVGIVLIGLYLLTMYLIYKAEYNRYLKAKRTARPG
ncbi:hypothetical protein MXB_4443, partial [Myxobolus squamalis]